MYTINVMKLPHLKMTDSGNAKALQALTRDNLAAVLEMGHRSLAFNMMTNRPEFRVEGVAGDELSQQRELLEVKETLAFIGVPLTHLGDHLAVLAQESCSYHPMEDWVLSVPWDGEDRLGALESTVPTSSPSWPLYLRKWLIQSVAAIRGWHKDEPQSVPHVLVFVGGQGANKGRWIRHLAPPEFVMADAELHLSGNSAKDQQIQVLGAPVVELGEIDSTFGKSAVSALKGFLSRQVDVLRVPYAAVATERPRMTTFLGSVNNVDFITDTTGARRFWPVQVTGPLDWEHGLDMQQVYAQVNTYYEAGEDYCIDDDARAGEIEAFVQTSTAGELLDEFHARHRAHYDGYAIMNLTSIVKALNLPLSPIHKSEARAWLEANLGPPRKLMSQQRSWCFPRGDGAVNVDPDVKEQHMGYIRDQIWYRERPAQPVASEKESPASDVPNLSGVPVDA